MRRHLRRDDGVYAILYAVLVVVLLGMAAIVVDIAQVRQDRRLDRSAADSAVTAGAARLNPTATGGASVYEACLTAWRYIALSLDVSVPAGACGAFASYASNAAITTYCPSPTSSPAEIVDDRTVAGGRTVRVAWPIPYHPGGTISQFLTPELAPGSASQTFGGLVDGTEAGCDRIGVAIFEDEAFGLGGGIGVGGTTTQVHSVARFNPDGGPADSVAALNILNRKDCNTLRATGGGQIYVGPVREGAAILGPGTIAVESAAGGVGTNCGGSDTVITTNGLGTLICANATSLTATCDGGGSIVSFAQLMNPPRAYNPVDVPTRLNPAPTTEQGQYGYGPVTRRYGCNTTALPLCSLPGGGQPNYAAVLEAAFNQTPPVPYTGYQAPLTTSTAPYQTAFITLTSAQCNLGSNGTLTLATAGNYYCPTGLNLGNNSRAFIRGGNLVVNGGVSVSNSACLVFNDSSTTCDATTPAIVGSDSAVTTATATGAPGMIYLRNGDLDISGSVFMPNTMVYARGSTAGAVRLGTSGAAPAAGRSLWTAPGAGAKNAQGRTALEELCYSSATATVSTNCMNSAFSRIAFWSDWPAPNTGSHRDTFTGSAQLRVVGVFFTPLSYFNLAGSSSLPLISQFWSDVLDVNGGASLPLIPDVAYSVEAPLGAVTLIR